jgi:hypothetical protein
MLRSIGLPEVIQIVVFIIVIYFACKVVYKYLNDHK